VLDEMLVQTDTAVVVAKGESVQLHLGVSDVHAFDMSGIWGRTT
jgi:hypothetical protein